MRNEDRSKASVAYAVIVALAGVVLMACASGCANVSYCQRQFDPTTGAVVGEVRMNRISFAYNLFMKESAVTVPNLGMGEVELFRSGETTSDGTKGAGAVTEAAVKGAMP